jgi:membrane-associated phospholipid phosphatase
MARQSNISQNRLPTDDYLSGRGYVVGQFLSRLFHPILLNVAMFLVVGYYAMATHVEGLKWALICILAQVVPPSLFFSYRMRRGAYSDEDVSNRRQRNELYMVGLGTVLAGLLILTPLGLPRPFVALLLCALMIGVINSLVNLSWKISVHATAIAAMATVTLLFAPRLGVALWLCALAVGWARVRTRNHTPLQVLGGFVVAVSVVLIVFRLVV